MKKSIHICKKSGDIDVLFDHIAAIVLGHILSEDDQGIIISVEVFDNYCEDIEDEELIPIAKQIVEDATFARCDYIGYNLKDIMVTSGM